MKLEYLQGELERITKEISNLREEMWNDPEASSHTPEGRRRSRKHFEGFNRVTHQMTSAIDCLNLASVRAESYPDIFPDRFNDKETTSIQ